MLNWSTGKEIDEY